MRRRALLFWADLASILFFGMLLSTAMGEAGGAWSWASLGITLLLAIGAPATLMWRPYAELRIRWPAYLAGVILGWGFSPIVVTVVVGLATEVFFDGHGLRAALAVVLGLMILVAAVLAFGVRGDVEGRIRAVLLVVTAFWIVVLTGAAMTGRAYEVPWPAVFGAASAVSQATIWAFLVYLMVSHRQDPARIPGTARSDTSAPHEQDPSVAAHSEPALRADGRKR